MESMVIAGICCLGFFIAGVKGWLVLGLLAGFLNIVPYLVRLLGAVPPMLITLLVDEPIITFYVVITILIWVHLIIRFSSEHIYLILNIINMQFIEKLNIY